MAGPTQRSGAAPARAAGLRYRVEMADLHAHLFRVSLRVARPAAVQRFSLPVWIPGSYLVREFSRHLQQLRAVQRGAALAVVQVDKGTWDVTCQPGQALELVY